MKQQTVERLKTKQAENKETNEEEEGNVVVSWNNQVKSEMNQSYWKQR